MIWNTVRIRDQQLRVFTRGVIGIGGLQGLSFAKVAFLVSCSIGVQGDLQERMTEELARQLPRYMVPLHFLELPSLPRLASQKVDRQALREHTLGLATRAKAEEALAGGALEDQVLSYWADAQELIFSDHNPEIMLFTIYPQDGNSIKFLNSNPGYLDSLGFARAVSLKRLELYNLWDSLAVLAMVNVILFHWFWCVLVEPQTYKVPSQDHPQENAVSMPRMPTPDWLLLTYQLATQDWAYGVFCFAAAAHTASETSAFTRRDAAILMLYIYAGKAFLRGF